jgi:hypothetical protein
MNSSFFFKKFDFEFIKKLKQKEGHLNIFLKVVHEYGVGKKKIESFIDFLFGIREFVSWRKKKGKLKIKF